MIETMYGAGRLVLSPGPQTFFLALLIGIAFGVALENGGFGSSRRLAGIFYFRDMAVLKVMFTGLVTGTLGLTFVVGMGWLDLASQVNLLPTAYAAQAVGGLIFGVGFVLSGWCPGTAAVGIASGKLDALVFLGGTVIGAIAYNMTYGWTEGLRSWGRFDEPQFAFGMSTSVFGFLLAIAAVAAFYFAEWTEELFGAGSKYLRSSFLRGFGLTIIVLAGTLLVFPGFSESHLAAGDRQTQFVGTSDAEAMLAEIEEAADHFEPEELADRLVQGDEQLVVVDVRSREEFDNFHLRGAVHVPLPELTSYLAPHKNRGTIVLYSNGMTHPAQARDLLAQLGFQNVYMLTGGLSGFVEWCLKPVSLRNEPLSPQDAQRVRTWRAYFLEETAT
jgi:thiosulfate/3-mercaptopyruvate sulfurtransferase